jgi:hypothetical protein
MALSDAAERVIYVGPDGRPTVGTQYSDAEGVIWSSADRAYGWHVAQASRGYLEAKADRLEARAAELRDAARAEAVRIELATGQPPGPEFFARVGVWHEQRALGARERGERVDRCAADQVMKVTCHGCGCIHERPARCSCALLCSTCRGHRKVELQGDFLRSRAVVMQIALAAGLLRKRLPGGAYGEKFLTLTLPHVERHGVSERIQAAFDAWPRFLKALSRFMRRHEAQHFRGEPPFRRWWVYRRFEWTPGSDGRGHPHFHCWLLAPYLPAETLARFWRSALTRAELADGSRAFDAAELAELLTPDIRQVRGGSVHRELIKYITKDWHDGARLPAHVYAEVFTTLDGRRMTQASRGFVGLGVRLRVCPDCSQQVSASVCFQRVTPETMAELKAKRKARGPPGGVPCGGELGAPCGAVA